MWILKSESGDSFSLTFESMSLEYSLEWCGGCCDYVEVSFGGLTQRYCGQSVPGLISSKGATMDIIFKSDNQVTYTGFLAVACCDLTVTTNITG